MKEQSRKNSIVLIIILILTSSIITLITDIQNPDVEKYQQSNNETSIDMPVMALATNGSDVPDWWVIILILLVVSIIGDIITIMMMFVKNKEKSEKAEGTKSESSSEIPVWVQTESTKGDSDEIGEDLKQTLAMENARLCPKCGNKLKSEYVTCPFCRRELKK